MEDYQPVQKKTYSLEKALICAGFDDVLDQKRFVLFKKVERDGRMTKLPKTPTGGMADSTNPDTWYTFKEVNDAYNNGGNSFDGIGIILGDVSGTRIVGVDLDHCIDAITEKFTNEEAKSAVSPLKTYGERSISGTGVHFLFKDQAIPEGYKTRTNATAPFDMEVYEKGRYFTLSGDRINDYELSTDEDGLNGIVSTYMPRKVDMSKRTAIKEGEATRAVGAKSNVGIDQALIADERFAALYNGKRPNGNESADDMALINYLVKYTGRDTDKVKKAFMESPHYQMKDAYHKEKCEGRDDYMARTIQSSVESYFTGYTFDDVGNSAMFTDTFVDELCFVPEWNCWCFYDGHRWAKKAEFHAQESAKSLSDMFRAKVDEFGASSTDVELVKAMGAHAKRMRSAKSIDNMLRLARSSAMKGADTFDSNPLIFNCKNGVYDMTTGLLREHSYTDYCTNVAGVEYNKDAVAPKWNAFLDKILPKDVQEYLQQCVGMAAVGKVYEEAMIFMIGGGSNGKSTIANILSAVFGDYAITLQPDIITATKDGKTPPDFAEVRGKRLVFLSETEEGDRLSTKALKRLSSNERQSARRLYSQPESFDPSHTVFYSTNHKPRIGSNDNGTWRRIKNIPFEYSFSADEKITNFAEQVINEEGSGVFAWCMEGAKKFIENGFKLPSCEIVMEATDEYRDNEDYLGQFVDEKCVVTTLMEGGSNKVRIGATEIYTAYRDWCKTNGFFYKNISEFNHSLEQMNGVNKVNSHGRKSWIGITLLETYDTIESRHRLGEAK